VERSLASAAGGRVDAWAKELRDELDDLGEALEQHIAITEAPDGLLADITAAAPRLVHRVKQTADDHQTLRAALDRARESLRPEEDAVREARDRVVELLTALVRHRHLGADLVYEAYNVDIEAGD
jgi:septal ring factor EnvC (AmiA/AmiB activator)